MSETYPDLEIYIKQVSVDAIVAWLGEKFEIRKIKPLKNGRHCTLTDKQNSQSTEIDCIILEKAAKGGFTSVWFKANDGFWESDEKCALDAFNFLGKEVRCSTGNWDGEDEGGWLRITDSGSKIINWFSN